MKKRILIFGGAGFIGSHLCKQLLENGNKVICADNLVTGTKKHISKLEENADFQFVFHDVCEPFNCEVDEIFNLACPASPCHYQADPIQTAKTCFLGALNLLELAKNNHAKILQASTSEVYGNPLMHPQTEDYRGNVNPIGPRACYDEGKRIAETLCFDYFRKYGTQIKIARIFNTYGTHMCQEDGRVVSNFIVQALTNQDLTIYGDGSQTRSFCYVSDLVEGMLRLINTQDEITGPVNLGNPKEITILELAKRIIELTGSQGNIVFQPLPVDDPIQRKPDIQRADLLLDWKPSVTLEDGLTKTIDYFKTDKTELNSLLER